MHSGELITDPLSYRSYLKSRPVAWETSAVQLMIDLCRKHKNHVHIVHVSYKEAISLVERAKKEGLYLTAETAPHYIYFNAEDIPDATTIYKCAPPIRDKKNNYFQRQHTGNHNIREPA